MRQMYNSESLFEPTPFTIVLSEFDHDLGLWQGALQVLCCCIKVQMIGDHPRSRWFVAHDRVWIYFCSPLQPLD